MGGAWAWLRLSYRQQRAEVFLLVAAAAALGIGMLWVSSQIVGLRVLRDACLADTPQLCDALVGRAYEPTQTAQMMLLLSELAPFAVGILLGVPLVAREIDGRTAQLAWSLSRSRTRWLIGRVLFVVAIALVCLGLLAWTSEGAAALLDPTRDLTRDFNFADNRGPILVARGFLALALAVLVGAVVGRMLPALLAAILLVAGVFIGFGFVDGAILKAEAQVVRIDPQTGTGIRGDHLIDTGLQLTDGTVLTWEQVARQGIEAAYGETGEESDDGCRYASEADMAAGRRVGCEVAWVVAGERYRAVVARRAAMLGGLGSIALIGAVAVVNRRRPE